MGGRGCECGGQAPDGWSEMGPHPRTLAQIVYELRTLLNGAGERPRTCSWARAAGLPMDSTRLRKVRNTPAQPAHPWAEPVNNSLTWYWWPAEYFPKLRWDEKTQRRWPAIGRGQPRSIPQCAWLHAAALERIRLKDALRVLATQPYVRVPAEVRSQPRVPPKGMQTDGSCVAG